MSAKTKKYINNLDIEKDAKMLRDCLNISNEALAHFYASSSILKAGTKAGLSLYEIAVMCCRNDNLGEVPSKLEVLLGMARDLAKSAIRNDRWDLAVASRAIHDQLSPHGGSLLTPSPKSGFGRKAASAFDLAGLANQQEVISSPAVPGMTQSAGSEESSSISDDVDPEKEDAEEWAAEIINAVSLDTSSRFVSKPRSHSIESDTSSEEGGFWHTSPNSPDDSWNDDEESVSNIEDEDSISWSSQNSPSKKTLGLSFLDTSIINAGVSSSDTSFLFGDNARRTSFQENSATKTVQNLFTPRMPVRVSFANIDNINFDRDEEKKDHDQSEKSEKDIDIPVPKPLAKMGRSRSYSVLSSSSMGEEQANDDKKTGNDTSFTEDQYRDYYLKFVDLVVVREVTAAAGARRSIPW